MPSIAFFHLIREWGMMMVVETPSSVTEDFSENLIFHFTKGIPGFDQVKDFAFIPFPEGPFAYLQSVEHEDISLVIADPFVFYPNYQFELADHVVEELSLQSNLLVRCVVTMNKDVGKSTLNLLAPIVLNLEMRSGRQVILQQSPYQTRHPLWREAEEQPNMADKDGE